MDIIPAAERHRQRRRSRFVRDNLFCDRHTCLLFVFCPECPASYPGFYQSGQVIRVQDHICDTPVIGAPQGLSGIRRMGSAF